MGDLQPYFTLKCITHRKDPIWLGLGGGPPGDLFKRLRYDLNMPHVLEVGPLPSTSLYSRSVVSIRMKSHTDQKEVWRTLEAFSEAFDSQSERASGKYIIAVDEDIDIRDVDMVWWALGTRVEPHRDFRIVMYTDLHPLASSYMRGNEIINMRRNNCERLWQIMKESAI